MATEEGLRTGLADAMRRGNRQAEATIRFGCRTCRRAVAPTSLRRTAADPGNVSIVAKTREDILGVAAWRLSAIPS